MAAVEQHIEYREELFPGDLVENRSGVLGFTPKDVRLNRSPSGRFSRPAVREAKGSG